jgi:hypothetical protein
VDGGSVTLGGGLTLEGHLDVGTRTAATANTAALVTVNKGQLVLADACIRYNYRTGHSGITGAGVEITSGTFTMTGGEIQCNEFSEKSLNSNDRLTSYGGGVGISGSDAKFIMKGGSVMNNAALRGGGVAIKNEGEFTMTGGKIESHSASLIREGGGVYLTVLVSGEATDAIFSMEGGDILSDSAVLGGGVCVAGGTFKMKDGTIQGNTGIYGAGVYIGKGYTDEYPLFSFAKTGGVIYGETGTDLGNISPPIPDVPATPAKKYGGAVWVDIPDTNNNVKIYFNTARRDVWLYYPFKSETGWVDQGHDEKKENYHLQDGTTSAPAQNLSSQ